LKGDYKKERGLSLTTKYLKGGYKKRARFDLEMETTKKAVKRVRIDLDYKVVKG